MKKEDWLTMSYKLEFEKKIEQNNLPQNTKNYSVVEWKHVIKVATKTNLLQNYENTYSEKIWTNKSEKLLMTGPTSLKTV